MNTIFHKRIAGINYLLWNGRTMESSYRLRKFRLQRREGSIIDFVQCHISLVKNSGNFSPRGNDLLFSEIKFLLCILLIGRDGGMHERIVATI